MTSKPQINLIWVFHFILLFFIYFFACQASPSVRAPADMRLMGREPQTESHTPPSLHSSVLPPFLPPSLADIHLNAFPSPQANYGSTRIWPVLLHFGGGFAAAAKWLTDGDETWGAPCLPANILIRNKNWFVEFFFPSLSAQWNGMDGGGGKMSPGLYFDLYVNEPRKRNWIFTLSHRIFFLLHFFFFSHTQRRRFSLCWMMGTSGLFAMISF